MPENPVPAVPALVFVPACDCDGEPGLPGTPPADCAAAVRANSDAQARLATRMNREKVISISFRLKSRIFLSNPDATPLLDVECGHVDNAARLKIDVSPIGGEEVLRAIEDIAGAPSEILDTMKRVLENKGG